MNLRHKTLLSTHASMGNVLATTFETSSNVLTGDPSPQTEPPPETPSPDIASPLPNGYVMYADGKRPQGFTDQCTFYCEYTQGIENIRIIMATVRHVNEIEREMRELQIQERQRMVRDLNSVKSIFENTFTIITYGQFCYRFQNVFSEVDIFYAPEIHMSDNTSIYHAFVVVENPQPKVPVAPPRPLLGRLWSMAFGEAENQPAVPKSHSQVSVLWYDNDYKEKITTFTDCKVVTKEIPIP